MPPRFRGLESTLVDVSTPERQPDPERGFGRDGVAGLVSPDRAVRAREVSRPSAADRAAARQAAPRLVDQATRTPRPQR